MVDSVFPDLIEVGLDVFNPFQPEVMDVYEMKRRYGAQHLFFFMYQLLVDNINVD